MLLPKPGAAWKVGSGSVSWVKGKRLLRKVGASESGSQGSGSYG